MSAVWPLPICLDSSIWHCRFLCNIALYSIGPCFYHQSHPQLGIVFALAPPFILSGVISPLISSRILGTYRPGEFIFQYPIILPFHTVHGVLKARILKWFAIPFSSYYFMLLGSIIGRDPSGVCKFLWITPKNNWSISGSSKIASHTTLEWNGYEISHLSHFTDKQLEGSKQELETIQ